MVVEVVARVVFAVGVGVGCFRHSWQKSEIRGKSWGPTPREVMGTRDPQPAIESSGEARERVGACHMCPLAVTSTPTPPPHAPRTGSFWVWFNVNPPPASPPPAPPSRSS